MINSLFYGIMFNLVSCIFWLHHALITGTWWFNGATIDSVGFLVFGMISLFIYFRFISVQDQKKEDMIKS